MSASIVDTQELGRLGARELRTADGLARAELSADGLGIRVHHGALLVLELRAADGVLTLAAAEGDLELRAARGKVSIHADTVETSARRVCTRAAEISWHAGSWRLTAGRICERAEHVVTVVHESLETRARQVTTVATAMFRVLSERTSMRSKDNTCIDGKRVLLG